MYRSNFTNSGSVRQRGAAMVEFALILPVLIVLVFGITELGRAIYQQNSLSKSVASGVRFLARYNGLLDLDDCSQTAAWGTATGYAANLVATGKESGAADALLPGLVAADVTFSLDPANSNDDIGCVIQGQATVAFVSIFGDSVVPLLNLGPLNLTATSEERYHGE